MGKTFRKNPSKYDDDPRTNRKGKQPSHSNNHWRGGMKIVNEYDDDNEWEDEVSVEDSIDINITHEQ